MSNDEDDEYFLRRVVEEIVNEGEDIKHLGKKSDSALYQLAQRISRILDTAIRKVLDALEQIIEMFH